MRIRRAKIKDLKRIIKLFKEEYSKKPYNEKWTNKTASKKIKEYYKEANIFVAVLNEKIRGFIIFSRFLWFDGQRGIIDEVVVDLKEQGKGIGKELIKYAENFLKRKEIKKIVLISHNSSKAFKIYKKFGYKTNNFVQMVKKIK